MNTRHINTRIVLSAALAAGIFFASAPMQAQAPALSNTQKLQELRAKITERQAQVDVLQARVNVLQAQIKRLQAQVRASSPSGVISPFYKFPDIQIPNYKIAPFQNPGIQGFQSPSGPNFIPQLQIPAPRLYSNIPPCSVTLIQQTMR